LYLIIMKTSLLIFITLLVTCINGLSQQADWKLNILNFMNNTEFGGSSVKIPQTMSGIVVSPEVGLVWDSVHTVNIGVNLLHEYGSKEAIDLLYPVAYYQYYDGHIRFIMGAFPRLNAIGNYPRLFYQDSISFYRPNINGAYWEYRNNKDYINLWIDWTGRQSETVNEAYFVGLSGRYNRGIFYLQNFTYLFHYAEKMNSVVEEPLHDNGLLLTSAGVDLSGRTIFNKLEANAGWVLGMERSRAGNTGWIPLNGFFMESRIEYRWMGFFNTFYAGEGLMYFYKQYGNALYWGDPVYRVKAYDRSDIYINFLQNRKINIQFTFSFHFLEGRVYNEQLLKVDINLSSLRK
jgi:hypothetical protein